MSEQKGQKKWYEHPLANVVVGFLLTGVLGTALTQHFLDRRERQKLRAQAALDRKEAVKSISELLASAHLQTELFAEAMQTVEPEDVIEMRKTGFQEAYNAWRVQRGSLTLLSRDLMTEENYRHLDEFVHRRLTEGALLPLRRCLLNTYAASKGQPSGYIEPSCDLDALMKTSRSCSDAVVETLYVFAAAGVSRSGEANSQAVRNAIQRANDECP